MKTPALCFVAALIIGFIGFSIAGERYHFASGPSSISMRDQWTGKLYYLGMGASQWREASR